MTAEVVPFVSTQYEWKRRAGLFLSIRYLRRHAVPVVDVPLDRLPRLSRRAIKFALRVHPSFLSRADLTFPVIVAGVGRVKITLDGRHRISKAIWTGHSPLPTVHVPLWYALELLFPGVYEIEWLFLFLRKELRHTGRRPSRVHPTPAADPPVPHPGLRGGEGLSGVEG